MKNILRVKSAEEFVETFKEVNITIPDSVAEKFYYSSLSVSGLQQVCEWSPESRQIRSSLTELVRFLAGQLSVVGRFRV